MIIYNFLEEVRMIIYLLSFGISVVGLYDIFILEIKNKTKKVILEIIYSLCFIIYSYYFSYELKEGYIPQYSLLIILLGIVIYFYKIKPKTQTIKKVIYKLFSIIKTIFKKVFYPFKIFKLTLFELFNKKKKNNDQNALQK